MIEWLRRSPDEIRITLNSRDVPLAIRRNNRAKRMILRLASDGGSVQVTLPPWGRTADALRFAEKRRDWLERQQAGIPERIDPVTEGTLPYRGDTITLDWSEGAPRKVVLHNRTITVGGPREGAIKRVGRWLERECTALSEPDLAHYCAIIEREPPSLRLSRAQRRWGSCSSEGLVRINWRLIMAPDAVRRSVIAHEVAHLLQFDHSPAFYAALDELVAGEPDGEHEQAQAWLKANGRTLFAPFG